MTSRRDIISALLRKQIPERMGVNEHFWPFIRENAWTAQGLPEKVPFHKLFDLDLASAHWYNLPDPRPDLVANLEETAEWKMIRGPWGDVTKVWKTKAGTPEHVGFAIDCGATWRREFREQFLAADPLAGVKFDEIRATRDRLRADDRFVTYSFMFVFEWARKVIGDVVMLESLLVEPEFIQDFNRVLTDKFLQFYQRLFAEVGLPDGIHMYEDLGYTQSAFCSPACHREFVLPYHRELIGFFKDHGLPVILHTCGDFRPHLPAIESGVDCIQAMEAKTGMNVVDLARDWKDKLCFMGNLDVRAFESGDRQRLAAEVLGKMRGMKELRAPYVVMSDHSIPPTVRLDTFRWYLDLVRRNYRY